MSKRSLLFSSVVLFLGGVLYTQSEIAFLRSQIALEVIRRDGGKCFLCEKRGDRDLEGRGRTYVLI